VPAWDFSTNANACGPAPVALQAVLQADASRYPDPAATALRETLGRFHGVPAARIVIAASASEFIFRLTAAVARLWPQASVHAPQPGYADYAAAAQACGLRPVSSAGDALLVWCTEPGSPRGQSSRIPATRDGAVLVVDLAYAPLRLEGPAPLLPAVAWQLVSPNKALGLTGVRGAYAIAPEGAGRLLDALLDRAPSWPLGAHGVAMLAAWAEAETQAWVRDSLVQLREWKERQRAGCAALGWELLDSVTPFFVARGPDDALLAALRARGVKLRDAASLGMAGWVRLSVQPPAAQQVLFDACGALR
jgi:histidinol-phosphate aminotransferase